ncbi:MAG: hypothetical protein Q9213_002734 [Squamulea squamosa]
MEEAIERVHALAAFARLRQERSDPQITALAFSDEESSINLPFFERLPSPPSHFIGREEQLKSIWEHLQIRDDRSLRSVVIWGIGGVGKTSLASVFVAEQRKADNYDAILWLHSESHTRLLENYTDVAVGLNLPGANRGADHESNYVQVRRWLGKTGELNPVMLAESFKAPGQVYKVELHTLDPEKSLELFDDVRKTHAGSDSNTDEAKDVKELLDGLGGLPLGIEQMAACIGHRNYSVSQFLSKYHKLAKNIHSRNDAGHESRTLGSLWEMNFEYLRKEHENAAMLMGLLSILEPDAIPVELFMSDDCEVDEQYASFIGDEAEIDDALELLMQVALRFEMQTGTKHKLRADKGVVKLFIDCAWYLYEIGEFNDCLDLLTMARTAWEEKSGYEYGLLCNHETCAYHDLFRLQDCKRSGEECERVLSACLPPDDLDLGNAYNNLGICCLSEGLVDEGIEKLERSKQIRMSAGASGLLYVSACHINLGIAQLRKGLPDLAAEHMTKAEKIVSSQGDAGRFLFHCTHLERGNFAYREQMAPTVPRMVACHHKLGLVDLRLGKLESAITHFDKALSIAEFRDMKGEMARSLWQKANALNLDPSDANEKQEQCQNLRTKASLLRMQVFEQSGLPLQDYGSEDEAFNNLVANSFR